MTKDDIAAALDEIGTLLELKGESSFRTNTYHNAARVVSQYEGEITTAVRDGTVRDIRGIGDSLAEKITMLVKTGSLPYLDELRAAFPPGLMKMLRVPGLGPKKVKVLFETLHIETLDALKASCEAGDVAKLKGFGAKTQEKILTGIASVLEYGNRVRFDQAYPLGVALLDQLSKLPGVVRSALCGSLRRRRETAKDIDILISSADPKPIMAAFVALPEVLQVTGHGETKSSIVARLGKIVLNADLRIVRDEDFPFALMHFTGSKEHNIRLRERAIELGLSLNEYGLKGESKNVEAKDEADIYRALGMRWIPPEMREDTGEVELARSATPMPKLIEAGDIKGVFHNHTTYSDGVASLMEMALAAQALGFEYFGVGDHSQSLTVANGLSPERVRKQWDEIDAVNAKLKGIRVLKGIECDILQDGTLDYDDELLAGFEYVVASVHSYFDLPAADQTARICKALSHPAVTMLGHATGRLLLRRDGYKLDVGEVLKVAAAKGKMIEINAQPMRLDLDWVACKRAKQMGVPLVINPDAHSPEELEVFPFGVDVARRAWLTADDVFNTRPLNEVVRRLGIGR